MNTDNTDLVGCVASMGAIPGSSHINILTISGTENTIHKICEKNVCIEVIFKVATIHV